MSAYMQSHRHIDYLVDQAKRYGIGWTHDGTYTRAQELDHDTIGSILVTEQLASVSYRYPQDTLDDLPGYQPDIVNEYHHRPKSSFFGVAPAQVLSACSGYEYQSCEHPGWKTSEARQIIETIKAYAIAAITREVDSMYWSLDDSHIPARYRRA